ncbi:MAG TPA: hypothetical protein VJ912_00050 [Candidatus Nanoarchaeia archaeon]|nr:hypothetical protein [Candidatus Nanoarchaeia archaeon]
MRTTSTPQKETFTKRIKVSKKTEIITTIGALMFILVAFIFATLIG